MSGDNLILSITLNILNILPVILEVEKGIAKTPYYALRKWVTKQSSKVSLSESSEILHHRSSDAHFSLSGHTILRKVAHVTPIFEA